jgi:hypothetical protein
MAKRKSKQQSDVVQYVMGRVGLVLVGILLGIVAPLAFLWWAVGEILETFEALRFLTAGLAYSVFVAFALGVQYGKVESNGVLEGIDAALGELAKAVDLRDQSTARNVVTRQMRPAKGQHVDLNVLLPGQVPITQRQIDSRQVIDL